ncbi:IST1-like protein, partial [Mucuna pruriens]
MRSDIAKLLEAGQEAKASVKVEHVMREENMMAAQDIIQPFCEHIVARLPMIQSQRECPLDLKEAISSVCFAAPRCTDLPELLQVQLLFASKYGKDFVSAATGLTPHCSVNRQLIELLSVQAPSQEKKLNLLKEIAIEHKLDWDPTASEAKFFKKHDDLLNGPIQFCSQCESKLPLPEEKHSEVDLHSSRHSGSDKGKPHAETAEVRISKLTKKNSVHVPDSSFENPFYAAFTNKSETEREHFTEQNTACDYDGGGISDVELEHAFPCSHSSTFDTHEEDFTSSLLNHSLLDDKSSHHQLKRLPSVDDYSGFSYPNLFTSRNSNIGSHTFR